MKLSETNLIALLKKGDEYAFEQVFTTNFKRLHMYACSIVKSENIAKDIVQNVFYKIWNKRAALPDGISLKAYLYRAVHNESVNTLKHQKITTEHKMHVVSGGEMYGENASVKIHSAELQANLRKALNELPEQCRTIFQMSRFEEMKYKEIADELNISPKTVENQMGKALKMLRAKLAHFLPFFMIAFCNL